MNRREHQPDVDAAAYVSGIMRPRARRRFERHILSCETCWREVRLDRRGRHLAELGRESAPADLREGVRAAVAARAASSDDFADAQIENMPSFPARRRVGLSAVAAALVVLIVAGAFAWHGRSGEPAPITAALDTYRTSAVSESDHHMMPPDLGNLGLESMGAETMALADMPVEAFAYRDHGGNRLTLFMAHTPFPPAAEAGSDEGGSWRASHDGMTLLGGTTPVAYLAVSSNAGLVDRFQGALTDGSVVIS